MSLVCIRQDKQDLVRQIVLVWPCWCWEKHDSGHMLCPHQRSLHQGLTPWFIGTAGGDVSHTLSQRTHSATSTPDMSQPSTTEPVAVSFAVTHVALHNNQELTGTVSFHHEQQSHWSCLSADIRQQHVGFHFSPFVVRTGTAITTLCDQVGAHISDDFPRTPTLCCEQISLVHFPFSCTQTNNCKWDRYLWEHKPTRFLEWGCLPLQLEL